ncbi:flagellar motor switch protein FliG [Thermanaeromonas toyohensis]|uniref:flagellar motor switch protein FliG n=1 Tax=Thermanaeromonas toyohensis TaxID=161154 RepID=UPI00155FA60B|nr:flagellar motor switch protein FliG [Thermanaeromonas toyohensis]
MTGPEKAAVVVTALPQDVAVLIMRNLTEQELETLTLAVASLKPVSPETTRAVLEEFRELCAASLAVAQGGLDRARALLEGALGRERAAAVVKRLAAGLVVPPLDTARRADPAWLAAFLGGERAQIAAAVLAYLPPEQAARVLEGLPEEKRPEVIYRMATLRRLNAPILAALERYLERQVFLPGGEQVSGSPEAAARVLGRTGQSLQEDVLRWINERDPGMAEEIRRNMFVFEDLLAVSDRDLQRVLRHVDIYRDLPLALKGAPASMREKFLRCLSSDAAAVVRDAMEAGPVPKQQVEEARRRIIEAARKLEAEGKITLARRGEEGYVA